MGNIIGEFMREEIEAAALASNGFKGWLVRNVSLKDYGKLHELLNVLTHLAGSLITAGILVYILIFESIQHSRFIVPILIYALCMLILYTSSTVYHFVKHPVAKRFFRMLDHTNIYLLIAGTYTPILMAAEDKKMSIFLIIVWGLAIAGMISTFAFWEKFKILHVLSYLALGWVVVLVGKDLFKNELLMAVFPWLLAGGLFYTVGVILYAIQKIPYHHAIWHVFVFMGSAMIFFGIMLHVLPAGVSV